MSIWTQIVEYAWMDNTLFKEKRKKKDTIVNKRLLCMSNFNVEKPTQTIQ